MKAKERVIYNNYDLDDYEADAKEMLEANGIEDPCERQIWDEIYEMDAEYWEDEKGNLREIFDNGKFLAVGTCGRWNGNFAGGFIFDSFAGLMSHFSDCDYIKLRDENGHFYIQGSHHDGTHSVEIKRITQKGNDYYENWNFNWGDKRTEREVHTKMFSDSHYTNLINFAHDVYGCPRREAER